jgi:DNA-binding SARP family transcriptional activator
MTVVGPDGPIVNAASQPKRLALLALLARAGERGVTRDKALGYFWPDFEQDRARRSLANALWAMKRDLDSEDLLLPGNDLRLNPDVVSADVQEFENAIASGDLERAATLYEGPFLDGFRLTGAPEFDRWVDAERSALAHKYANAAEKLARSVEAKGQTDAAVGWWRKIAAHDPLNARVALGLMRALVAAGDRVGAVRHAQIYEALVEQDLDLPPDRAVVAYAAELREELATVFTDRGDREVWAASDAAAPASAQTAATPIRTTVALSPPVDLPSVPGTVAETPVAVVPAIGPPRPDAPGPTDPTASGRQSRLTGRTLAWAAVTVAVVAAALFAARGWIGRSTSDDVPVIALGQIADYRKDRSTEIVKPLTDMLATALARSPTVRVVSTARMYELGSRLGPAGSDSASSSTARAARAAGATELLEGSLYALDDGTLRLDLRCVDIATGNVRTAHSVVAKNPFALADSSTARLIAELGGAVPNGSIADVTTQSLAAYRFYEEGVRAYYQDDLVSAERLLKAALAEDSTFASAAYYLARSYRQDEVSNAYPMLERAVRLSARASDRERLCIRASWEERTSSRDLSTTAESLMVRYPQEVEGYYFTGIVRLADGDFLGAVPFLERAIAMDSLSLQGSRSECTACEAFTGLLAAYQLADSLPRAERTVRRWLKLQPQSGIAYAALVEILMRQGRIDEAIDAWRARARLAPGYEVGEDVVARVSIQGGRYAEADELMRSVVATGTPARRVEGYWLLGLSARYQGRLRDALQYATEEFRASRQARADGGPPIGGVSMGQVLQELGRGREAAAIFDAFAHWEPGVWPSPQVAPGMTARHRAWNLAHAAAALASAGDTATLASRADTIQYYGARTLYRLHRDLHHHVRGLLLAARHQDEDAIAEFRQALWAPGAYTRTNYELGRLLLRRGRAAEAVAAVAPALRSGVEATSYYVTRVELHELLAQAWDSLGSNAGAVRPAGVSRAAAVDSAVTHYDWVARAWKSGDPAFAQRAATAAERIAALKR